MRGTCLCILLGMAFLLHVQTPVYADMQVTGYSAAVNDRFYTGSDKNFVGQRFDWSGVGRPLGNTDGELAAGWATMISPSMFLTSDHNDVATNCTVRFYYTNNPADGYEDRKVIWMSSRVGGDLKIGQLETPLSSRIATYALVNSSETAKLAGEKLWLFGKANLDFSKTDQNPQSQRLGRNILTIPSGDGSSWWNYDSSGSGDYLGTGVEARAEPGDSGAPSFVLWNDRPVISGTRWMVTGDCMVSPWTTAIQSIVQSRTGGSESAVFAMKPMVNPIPILRETYAGAAPNSTPTAGAQTFRLRQSTNSATTDLRIAGAGGTYADPFGKAGNQSVRMYSAASGWTNVSRMQLEGLQTGIGQGRFSMDLFVKKPSESVFSTMMYVLGGDAHDDDSILDDTERFFDIGVLASGYLNIRSGTTYLRADQRFTFDTPHVLQVDFVLNGSSRAYEVLLDGVKLTAGGTSLFQSVASATTSSWMVGLDTIYLGSYGVTGTGGANVASEIYVDNITLVPEPATLTGVLTAALLLVRRRQGGRCRPLRRAKSADSGLRCPPSRKRTYAN